MFAEELRENLSNSSNVGGWWRDVVLNGVDPINKVNQHRARLLLGWVTVFGQINHL